MISLPINAAWLRSWAEVLRVDGASLLMRVDGLWRSIAASDETGDRINAVQLVTGQGPGVQALYTGQAVKVPNWAHDARHWPLFSAGIGTESLGAVFALPLYDTDDGSAHGGVLHLYRHKPGIPNAQDLDALWLAAETMTGSLAI